MAELFDINRFMDHSGRVDLSDIDWAMVPKHPMTPEALRTLRYFMVTEGSTFFYVKALMKTKAATDKLADAWWSAWGLPTRRDQERSLHALNQIQSRLADIEEKLAAKVERKGNH